MPHTLKPFATLPPRRFPGALFPAVLAAALLAGAPAVAETVCHSGTLVRTVDIVYAEPGHAVPCEVLYNKKTEGSQTVLWRADHQAGYCEEKTQAFIAELEGMGWQCADERAAAVQSTTPQPEPSVTPAPAAEPAPSNPTPREGDLSDG